MNDLLPAEPPLITAHERLAVALALLGDYLDPQPSPTQLAAVALRMQLVIATAVPLAEALANLTQRTTHASTQTPSEMRPTPTDSAAVEEAHSHLRNARDKLDWAHDSQVAARKHLNLAEPEIHGEAPGRIEGLGA
ncbi:MAG: hypothetical protein JWN00_3153 [Actinomycetia bacterium]|nr:hypothetical protein [Actinomycetes bacterium]